MTTIRELRRQVQQVVNDFSTRKLLIVEYHGGRLVERSTGMVVPPAVARSGVRTICTNRGLIAAPPLQCHSGPLLKLSDPPPAGSLAALWCLAGGLDCPRHQNGFRAVPWCAESAYFRWIAFTAMESKDRWIKQAGRIWSFAAYMQDLQWQAEQRRASDHLSAWQERYDAGVTVTHTDTQIS